MQLYLIIYKNLSTILFRVMFRLSSQNKPLPYKEDVKNWC